MATRIDDAIAVLAGRQHGYVARGQLLGLGLGPAAIKYRVRAGRLIPVYQGVYAVGHKPTHPLERAHGALLACGPHAVLSHGSAAVVWGIFKRWAMPFEVTVPTARRRPGIRVHRAALTREDIRTNLGIRVTSPARTLLDITPRLADRQLTRALSELRLANHLRLEQLAELLERYPHRCGAARLRGHVVERAGPTRSEFEDAFVAFVERYGLPKPIINTRVAGLEVDALFPVERLIVELDGWRFHSSLSSFQSDRERDAQMLALDLPTVRITWERLTNAPRREAARLHAILERRRRQAA